MLGKHGVQESDQAVEHVQVLAHPDVDDTAVLLHEVGAGRDTESSSAEGTKRASPASPSSNHLLCGWLQARPTSRHECVRAQGHTHSSIYIYVVCVCRCACLYISTYLRISGWPCTCVGGGDRDAEMSQM